jgi:CBS domain containing-hemolysin-like protein
MNEHTSQVTAAPSDTEADGGEQAGESPEPGRQSALQRPTLLQRVGAFLRPRNGNSLREDLTDALSEAADAAEFSPGERAMLNNILRLREVRVEDVMVPRAEVEAVDISIQLGELLRIFEQSGHSRLPVYSETLDDPRGMVHIRDVVGHLLRMSRQPKRGRSQKKIVGVEPLDLSKVDLSRSIGELSLIRPLLFVPPSMLASDLMARMQADRIQMALVIDEYGGTDGLASLEDIVEMVVGDIEDEHDEDEPLITQTGDGVFVVDARAEIDEVAAKVGDAFKAGEHEEDVDTIGGMIFNTLGRVPARGEVVQAIPGFEFHVLDADPRRVKRVRIVQLRAADRKRRFQKAPLSTGA